MNSATHKTPPYIDVAHRAALMYSFAALVMAELLRFSPYSEQVQLTNTGIPLFFFAVAIGQYFKLGIENTTANQFSERNFIQPGEYRCSSSVRLAGLALSSGVLYQHNFLYKLMQSLANIAIKQDGRYRARLLALHCVS